MEIVRRTYVVYSVLNDTLEIKFLCGSMQPFSSAVWCTRSHRVSDAKRSELLAKNLQQDLKNVTAAFVGSIKKTDAILTTVMCDDAYFLFSRR